MLIFLNQHKERAEPAFVPFAFEELFHDSQRCVNIFLCDYANIRDCYADELVAFAIFAFSGLEESWENGLFLLVGQRTERPRYSGISLRGLQGL